jgi:hypothetical protein
MWSTVIATAVAAALGLSLVNVASQMSRIRDAKSLADSARHAVFSLPTAGIEKHKASDPGA